MEKGPVNEEVFSPFNKKGIDFSYYGSDVNWKQNRRGRHGKTAEAFFEERSLFRGNDSVWRRPGEHGPSIENGRDNGVVVRRHNICRRPKRSVLPRSLEEKNSPLHVTKIEPMSILFVKERMSQKRLKRFNFVWDLTFYPHKVCHNTSSTGPLDPHASTLDFHSDFDHVMNFSEKVSSFSRLHADLLVENGIAQETSQPSEVENIPFTVVEQKATGLRQRFILWTKESNERLVDDGYVADVPLGHISEYLDSVLLDCASGRDFRTGFYQVEIPHDARKFFSFRSDDGQFFELTRLPMGHSCAPEIMHTLAATIAGHPDYVKPDIAIHDVRVDVWIDNIRYSGPAKEVKARTTELDGTAMRASATWKQADSFDLSVEYEFLGVQFSHLSKTVVVSKRLQSKITSVDLFLVSASGLESLMGRLMHASAVSGVSPGRFWFALKFIRRIINKINRGILGLDDAVHVPRSVRLELSRWMVDAVKLRTIKKILHASKLLTVFVDASLEGWGGVVVGALTVVGDIWRQEKGLHINILEAKALLNTLLALDLWDLKGFRLDIRVDNTSVMGAVRKRQCQKNKILNDVVLAVSDWLIFKKVVFSVKYIKSALNQTCNGYINYHFNRLFT